MCLFSNLYIPTHFVLKCLFTSLNDKFRDRNEIKALIETQL